MALGEPGGLLRFPRVAGVKASRQGRDIDYTSRAYFVKTKAGPQSILHGQGSTWTLGAPADRIVWSSVEYEETLYDRKGTFFLDARGKFPNGLRWRYLGTIGESATYDNANEASARVLDQVLDGACVARR